MVGRIRGVRLAVDKVVGADGAGGWRWYDECEVANPALIIDLTVEDAMTGKVPKAASVRVGWAQLQHFRPLPYTGEDGALAWTAVRSEAVGPLRPGNRVVMGLHRVEGDWSLMGDTILGVDADDRIHVPRRPGDCFQDDQGGRRAPGPCRSTRAGSDRRRLHELQWGAAQTPAFYSAGYCTDEVPALAVEPDGLPSLETKESGKPSAPPARKRQRP